METNFNKITWDSSIPNYAGTGIKSARNFANIQFVVSIFSAVFMVLAMVTSGNYIMYITYILTILLSSYVLKLVLLLLATIAENQLIEKYKTMYRDINAGHLANK